MRVLGCVVFLMFGVTLLAQQEGDRKDIDGQTFEFQKGIWVHKALGNNFDPTEEYTAVFRDSKWQKWYQEGSPGLKKILDLGRNVVFTFNDRSGVPHVYWVLESKDKVQKLLAGGAAALLPGLAAAGAGGGAGAAGAGGAAGGAGGGALGAVGIGIGVGAVVVGGIVVANNDDDDESRSKRKN